MSGKYRYLLICFCGLILCILINCASSASSTDKKTPSREISPPYYTGSGGAGMRLGILMPQSQGLNENQTYLPTMIQGVLVANISKYSAISVLDRVSLDKIIAETLDPTYEDNFDIVRLGHVTQVGYMMTGRIMRTSTGYSLQINVTDTTPNANTIASYSGTFTAVQLDDQTAIQKASQDLLEQMGVNLTEKAINELNTINSQQSINAQTALAQGITAQRSGTIVEALTYYYEAVNFDRNLVEASSRSSILSADIQSGNLGENVRNDIQHRNAWLKILQEAAMFFKNHPPFEILYSPTLTWGKVDYSKETVDISFEAGLFALETGFKVLNDLKQGLDMTGRSKDWGFENWPSSGDAAVFTGDTVNYRIRAALLSEDGSTIGNAEGAFFAIDGLSFIHDTKALSFRNVNANKISDNLRISIVSVNGRDAKTVGEQGYIGLSVEDGVSVIFNKFRIALNNGEIVITGYRDWDRKFTEAVDIVIPSKIGRWPVTSIGKEAFMNENLASVTIPDSVISIGILAFSGNSLTSIVIPNGVTSIGHGAFSDNSFISIVIPDSITSIEDFAFNNKLLGKDITMVTIPSNVSIGSYAFGFNSNKSILGFSSGYFEDFYNRNGKKAGTYVFINERWSRK